MDSYEFKIMTSSLQALFKNEYYERMFMHSNIDNAHTLYVPVLGCLSESCSPEDEIFNIEDKIIEHIQWARATSNILIFGDSGSGKSSLALHLTNRCWDMITNLEVAVHDTFFLPMYIPLRSIELSQNNNVDLVTAFIKHHSKYFEKLDIEATCKNLKTTRIVLILDGFDELKVKSNLWKNNDWGNSYKNIKTVTFTRPEAATKSDFKKFFENSVQYNIINFSLQQINTFIEKVVQFLSSIDVPHEISKGTDEPWLMTKEYTLKHRLWEKDSSEYKKWIEEIFAELKVIANNPFLLTMIVQCLPGIVAEECNGNTIDNENTSFKIRIKQFCATEVGIYDQFINEWFSYQVRKVKASMNSLGLCNISSRRLKCFFWSYAQNLSTHLIRLNKGLVRDGSISLKDTEKFDLWVPSSDKFELQTKYHVHHKHLFPQDENDKEEEKLNNLRILRNACMLKCNRNEVKMYDNYQFFHASLVEYFASRDIFKGVRGQLNYHLKNIDRENVRDGFVFNYDNINSDNYSKIRDLLVQRAKTDVQFRTLLIKTILMSKEISSIWQMSANAMTVLCCAGYNFSGMNLQNVSIPSANLTNALCANTDFRGANISKAIMHQGWFFDAKFQGANLDRCDLGRICPKGIVDLGKPIDMEVYTESNGFVHVFVSHKSEDGIGSQVWDYCMDFNGGQVIPTCRVFDIPSRFSHYLSIRQHSDKLVAIPVRMNLLRFAGSRKESIYVLDLRTGKQNFFNFDFWVGTVMPYTIETNGLSEHFLSFDNENKLQFVSKEIMNTSYNEWHCLEIRHVTVGELKEDLMYFYTYSVVNGLVLNDDAEVVLNAEIELMFCGKDQKSFRLNSNKANWNDPIAFNCFNKPLLAFHLEDELLLLIIDVSKGKEIIRKELDEEIQLFMRFSPNGEYLVYKTSAVYIWRQSDNRITEIPNTSSHGNIEYAAFACTFHKDSEYLAIKRFFSITICRLTDAVPIHTILASEEVAFEFLETPNLSLAFIGNRHIEIVQIPNVQNQWATSLANDMQSFATYLSQDGRVKAVISCCPTNSVHQSFNLSFYSIQTFDTVGESLLFETELDVCPEYVIFTPGYFLILLKASTKGNECLKVIGAYTQCAFFLSEKVRYNNYFYQESCQNVFFAYSSDVTDIVSYKIAETNNVEEPIRLDKISHLKIDFWLQGLNFDLNINNWVFLVPDGADPEFIGIWNFTNNKYLKLSKSDSNNVRKRNLTGGDCPKKCSVVTNEGILAIEIFEGQETFTILSSTKLFRQFITVHVHPRLNCFLVGGWDGQLTIYSSSNNTEIFNFKGFHPIVDFKVLKEDMDDDTWVKIVLWDYHGYFTCISVDIDAVRNSMNLTSTEPSLRWKVLWATKPSKTLSFHSVSLTNTHNIPVKGIPILFDYFSCSGIKVENSEYQQKYIAFSDLFQSVSDTCSSIFNTAEGIQLSDSNWIISVIARKSKKLGLPAVLHSHAGIMLEGIRNNRHFAIKADLTRIGRKGIIQIVMKPLNEKSSYDKLKLKYVAKQWRITAEEGLQIINGIREDQQKELDYNLFNKNCNTWCKEKLKIIDWLDIDEGRFLGIHLDLPRDFFSRRDLKGVVPAPFLAEMFS